MNYRHAYHAGNFADVVKHAILALVIAYLARKDAAFRVIDTHAGIGLFDLTGEQAEKTGEWRNGVGKLWRQPLPAAAEALLAPWRAAIAAVNFEGSLRYYPGSPKVVRAGLRPQDRLILTELHPQDVQALRASMGRDKVSKVIELDGFTSLRAYVPPKERRGLVLVDPPFEVPGEFERLVAGLADALGKWSGGTYMLWYPIKDHASVGAFRKALAALPVKLGLDIEVALSAAPRDGQFDATGLVIINPPWTLAADLAVLLPALAQRLARDGKGGWRVRRFGAEAAD